MEILKNFAFLLNFYLIVPLVVGCLSAQKLVGLSVAICEFAMGRGAALCSFCRRQQTLQQSFSVDDRTRARRDGHLAGELPRGVLTVIYLCIT